MSTTKIKICGIRRMKDIEYVNEFLPDYIGFIFADSKRYIEPSYAKQLIEKLNPQIKTVGVFVNAEIDKIAEISSMLNLDVIQLHGDEDNNYILKLRNKKLKEVWKALSVKNSDDLEKLSKINPDRFLLDAYKKGERGGSGESFNWDILRGVDCGEIILAGGLNCGNIENAIKKVRPYMIDISSGAESDGFKDREKVRKCIELVRAATVGASRNAVTG